MWVCGCVCGWVCGACGCGERVKTFLLTTLFFFFLLPLHVVVHHHAFFFSCKNNQVRFNSKSRFKNTRICFERRQRIVAWIAAIVAGKSIGVWAQRLCIDSSHSFFQFFELGRLHCSKNSTEICTASAWRHRRAVF